MDQYSEINQLYATFTETQDNEERDEAHRHILEFQQQGESVGWVLSTYSTMNKIRIKQMQLMLMKQWFRKNWADLPHEIWEEFKKLLFVQANHNVNSKDESFSNSVFDAQLIFMWNSFPDMWPTFWNDYFSRFDNHYKLEFLVAFTRFSDGVEGKDNIIFKNIKDCMRSNKSDENITNFIIKMMADGEKKAFEVFISLCSWVNCLYLLSDTKDILKGALENEDYCKYALKIIDRLMNRGIQSDMKFNLIQYLEVPDRTDFILNNTSDKRTAEAAASLIDSIGLEFINFDIFEQIYKLAINCLGNDDDDVSSNVIPFLEAVCKNEGTQGKSKEIMNTIICKLELLFKDFQNADDCFNSYLEKLTVLSNKALKANHQENVNEALELFDDGRLLESNLNSAISIIYIVSTNLSNGRPDDLVRSAITKFSVILNVEQVTDPVLSFGIVKFITFFVAVGDLFQKEDVSSVFETLCKLVLSSIGTEENSFHKDLAACLIHFIKKLSTKIDKNFEYSIISKFIETHEEQLIRAAGSLISLLGPENQGNVFKASIGKLQEMFDQIPNEQKEYFVPIILSFVKSMNDVKDDSVVEVITELLKNFLDPCSGNDKLFELLIRTANSSLGDNCMEIIQECVKYIEVGNHSCNSFCKVMTSIIKSDKIQKAEWVGQIINILYDIITPKLESLQSYDLSPKQIDENKEIVEMTCSFIKFFSHAKNLANEYIEEQSYNRMKQFLAESLYKFFDIPDLIEKIIDFLSSVSKIDFDSICDDGFIKLAVNFLYTDKFDPSQKEWHKVIVKLLSFHQHLLQLNEERVRPLIEQSLAEFINDSVGEKPKLINDYFTIFEEKQPRDQKARGKEYFIIFKKVLISQLD